VPMRRTRRALIADDHGLYRHGLALLLKDQFGYREVLEASTFDAAVTAIESKPDIELALFDLVMPGMRGPASLTPLRLHHPHVKIAIVAASEAKSDVLAAIAAGLSGFIPKSMPIQEFIAALQFVQTGGIYVPGLMKVMEPDGSEPSRDPPPDPAAIRHTTARPPVTLTPRQKEVLDCVQAGMSNREISEKLQVSVGTVKFHVAALLIAMNVKNRIHLATFKS
jgi:DNA-binding NarL/FixJ family response regulator